jgi:hypothetical protein
VFTRTRELWYALVAALVVTGLYWLAYLQAGAFPRASSLVGHGIGVVGFLLMLMTETLYSIRKRRTDAAWGSVAGWLRFHVFTGLVGPYMVLLHTAMLFQGLAAVALVLTGVVVASGVVGRYLYTAVPRTIEGHESPDVARDADRTQGLMARRARLATWYSFHVPLTWVLFATAFVHSGAALFYATLQR